MYIYLNYYKKQSFKCLSLFPHVPSLLFQLRTRVPRLMAEARAPTSVSSTSTRPSPARALTSWSCSRTNAHAKVRRRINRRRLKPCVNCHDIRVAVHQQTASVSVLEPGLMASAAASAPRRLRQLSSHMRVNLIACLLSPPNIPLCFYFHFSSCPNAVALNAGVLLYSSCFNEIGDSWWFFCCCFFLSGSCEILFRKLTGC